MVSGQVEERLFNEATQNAVKLANPRNLDDSRQSTLEIGLRELAKRLRVLGRTKQNLVHKVSPEVRGEAKGLLNFLR